MLWPAGGYITINDSIKNSISGKRSLRASTTVALSRALPIDGEPRVGLYSAYAAGARPSSRRGARCQRIVRQGRLGQSPDFSYKDRVVSGGDSKAIEFCFDTFLARSTGNFGQLRGRPRSKGPSRCYVFIPIGSSRENHRSASTAKTVASKATMTTSNRLLQPRSRQYGWAFCQRESAAFTIPREPRRMACSRRSN